VLDSVAGLKNDRTGDPASPWPAARRASPPPKV